MLKNLQDILENTCSILAFLFNIGKDNPTESVLILKKLKQKPMNSISSTSLIAEDSKSTLKLFSGKIIESNSQVTWDFFIKSIKFYNIFLLIDWSIFIFRGFKLQINRFS